jgi:hypothetical protein
MKEKEMRRGPSLWTIIYIVIGIVVASTHGYLAGLGNPTNLIKAILAVILWPLVALLGIDIHAWF